MCEYVNIAAGRLKFVVFLTFHTCIVWLLMSLCLQIVLLI